MEVKAILKYIRISPRKVRLTAGLIKKMTVQEALAQLNFLPGKSAKPISKLLKSAIANAKHNFKLDPENLYVSGIKVDQGPSLKRSMPRARGSASPILKRSSHVTLILRELSGAKKTIKPSLSKMPESNVEKNIKDEKTKNINILKNRQARNQNKTSKLTGHKQKIFSRKAI